MTKETRNPKQEEFASRGPGVLRSFELEPQRLAVGELQLESAERSSVAHFLEVRDFHVLDPLLNGSIGILN